jgi:hypothetical protein
MVSFHRAPLMAALTLALLGTLVLSSVVAAVRPFKEPAPLPDTVDTSCGYPILVTYPVNDEFLIVFSDQSGELTRGLVVGNLVVTLTNAETGASLTTNISGPTFVDFRTGAFIGTGRWATAIDSIPLAIVSGRIDLSDRTVRGHVHLDVCEALAP